MSYTALAKSPSQKPPIGRLLDTMHPLCAGLFWCCLHQVGSGTREASNVRGGNKDTLTQLAVKRGGTAPRPSPFGGQGVTLDSTNGSAAMQTNPMLPGPPTDTTLSAWVYVTTAPTSETIIVQTASFPVNYLRLNATPAFTFYGRGGNSVLVTGPTIATGKWYHLAVTSSLTTGLVIAYQNGVKVGQTSGLTTTTLGTTQRVQYNATTSPTYVVSMDAVMYWYRVLQPAEIRLLWSDPFCMFQSSPFITWPGWWQLTDPSAAVPAEFLVKPEAVGY